MTLPLPPELLDPITDADPVGPNLRYDASYDKIKIARTEEEDLPQGEWGRERKTADHRLVIKLATELLAKRTKDLQVAAWLTEALTYRDGFAGLAAGLDLVRGLCERYWDGVHPGLEDGDAEMRAAPLDWIGLYLDLPVRRIPLNKDGHDFVSYRDSRLIPSDEDADSDSEKQEVRQKALDEGKLAPEAFDDAFAATPKSFYKKLAADIEAVSTSIDALDALGRERIEDPDVVPSYYRLRDAVSEVSQAVRQLLARKLEQDPDPPEDVGVDAAASDAAASSGAAAGAAATGAAGAAAAVSAVPKSREDAASRVAAAAKFMRSESRSDPAPFLMLRGLRWGELRAGGGRIDPKLLAAPPTDVRTRLKSLLLDAAWSELLEQAETVMATPFGRGWLDLQRYVLAACGGLGSEYDTVASAVRGSLRSLLQDLPGLLDMTLMDDSPTANRETRAWLADSGILGEAADAAAAEAESRPASAPRAGRDALDIAMDRVRSGQPQKAIELLMRESAQEKSTRARFLRRSQAARIMVEAGLEAVAMPILNEMLTQIEKHGLEEWEDGETIARPLGMLYRCMERLGIDSADKEQLYLRVCRLDPMQAIGFNSTANAEPGS